MDWISVYTDTVQEMALLQDTAAPVWSVRVPYAIQSPYPSYESLLHKSLLI